MNNALKFSCESQGQPLSSCLWGKAQNGQHQVIVTDQHGVQEEDQQTSIEGISYSIGHELDAGKCSVNIESVSEDDFGRWSCTLVSKSGAIFTGRVEVVTNGKLCKECAEAILRRKIYLKIFCTNFRTGHQHLLYNLGRRGHKGLFYHNV